MTLDEATGAFEYAPDANYHGVDSFAFVAFTSTATSHAAVVTLQVASAPDSPTLSELPDTTNSAHSQLISVPLEYGDADGDDLTLTTSVANTSIADASLSSDTTHVLLTPKAQGSTIIDVSVSDGTHVVRRSFNFAVGAVTRQFAVTSSAPEQQAIRLTNTSAESVSFSLTHNGHTAFATMDDLVAAIANSPDEIANEPFPRKAWRFVRDNTYHAAPIITQQWMLAAAPTLNSFGWGYCSNVAATLVQIANARGYPARMWALNGHVVPEIYIAERWQMYDPDLAVYYIDQTGRVAGVEQLSTDPTIVSAPTSPLLPASSGAYGTYVANIYGTTSDNNVEAVSSDSFHGARIELPAGASLTYPGVWTPAPIGYDNSAEIPITYYRQARLEIPAGHLSSISAPWVVAAVTGSGRIRLGDTTFDIGDPALNILLKNMPHEISDMTVLANDDGIAVSMFINALWYELDHFNNVDVTGTRVWALDVETVDLLPQERPPGPVPHELRKPRP